MLSYLLLIFLAIELFLSCCSCFQSPPFTRCRLTLLLWCLHDDARINDVKSSSLISIDLKLISVLTVHGKNAKTWQTNKIRGRTRQSRDGTSLEGCPNKRCRPCRQFTSSWPRCRKIQNPVLPVPSCYTCIR